MARWIKGCALGCVTLVLLIVFAGVAAVKWAGAPPPTAPKIGSVVALRPLFLRKQGEPFSAGTAVAVRVQPQSAPILLTALHLFGPSGGLEKDLAPAELDQQIREVWLAPISGKRRVVARARGALRKSGPALSENLPGVSEDVAAFKLQPKSAVNALPLAAANPKFGDWVWLVGDVFDHEPQTQRLFAGRVWRSHDEGTMIRLQERFPLRAFSGAPVINERKEVVGLLISGGEGGGIGIINPAGNIRRKLAVGGVD